MKKTIKVLHVYRTYFPDPPGGLQEAIRQICLATKEFNVESKVFTLSPTPIPTSLQVDETVVTRGQSLAAPASCDISNFSGIKLFKEQAEWADVIHYHFPWPFSDILNLFCPKNKPKILTYHSDIVRQKYLGLIYVPLMKLHLSNMDCIVATSKNYLKTSPALCNIKDKKKLTVIPLGIADSIRNYDNKIVNKVLDSFGLRNSDYVFSLGVLRYYKGFHHLIKAAKNTGQTIVIGGSGPEETSLKNLAESLHLDNVVFTGQLDDKQKHILMKAAKLFILPSHLRSEAFGMVLVEASMYAKPMITCDIGTGTSFVNQNEVTGLVVRPNDPEQLSTAINELCNDSTLIEKYGINSRERYEHLFSKAAQGKAYKKQYDFILN